MTKRNKKGQSTIEELQKLAEERVGEAKKKSILESVIALMLLKKEFPGSSELIGVGRASEVDCFERWHYNPTLVDKKGTYLEQNTTHPLFWEIRSGKLFSGKMNLGDLELNAEILQTKVNNSNNSFPKYAPRNLSMKVQVNGDSPLFEAIFEDQYFTTQGTLGAYHEWCITTAPNFISSKSKRGRKIVRYIPGKWITTIKKELCHEASKFATFVEEEKRREVEEEPTRKEQEVRRHLEKHFGV